MVKINFEMAGKKWTLENVANAEIAQAIIDGVDFALVKWNDGINKGLITEIVEV